jgi:hypothetical protein
MAAAWEIDGLEFLDDTVRFLSGDDLRAVSVAVNALFEKLTRESSPPTSLAASQLEGIRFQDLRDGVARATEAAVVDEATGDVHSFLQFLMSMSAAAEDARRSGRQLLYYKTHP